MPHCRVCKVKLKDGMAPPCDLFARIYVCRHGKTLGATQCPHHQAGTVVELDGDAMLADKGGRGGKAIISSWQPPTDGSVTLLHKCLQCEARWVMELINQIPSSLSRDLWDRQARAIRKARA